MSRLIKIGSFILSCAMLFCILLTGCNSKENNITKTTAQTDASQKEEVVNAKWDKDIKKTIVLSTINNYYTTALKQVANDYNSINTETVVEIEIIADNATYANNFKVKMAADKSKVPDIIHANLLGTDQGELINKGWLMPLDELLEETNPYNNGIKVKDVISDPSFLTLAISSTGKVSHLPFDVVGVGIFYNKTIFDKAGVKSPQTYEQWVEICEKLRNAGYKSPIGATSFNSWIMVSLSDWAYKKYIPELVSLPGDGRYNPDTMSHNDRIKYDPNDNSFDILANLDSEKLAIKLRDIDMGNEINQKIWETFASIAKYFPENFYNLNDGQAYTEFMAQKTPMLITGSWIVGQTLGEMEKLPNDQRFEWGTFPFPKFENQDPNFPGLPRGLKVAGHKMGIADKDDEDLYYRSADFLKYMYSKDVASKIYEITFKNNEYVQGPSLIKGVEISPEITGYIDGFNVAGNMKSIMKDLSGNWFSDTKYDTQVEFLRDAVTYINGTIKWDVFSKKLEKYRNDVVDFIKQNDGFDMDPKTDDKKAK